MRVATASSTHPDTRVALGTALDHLHERLGGEPHWVVAQASVLHDLEALRGMLAERFPAAAVHGGTSCLGVMTERGFAAGEGTGLGLFGVRDEDGAFGVGAASSATGARAAASEAVRRAIEAAGRPGEVPSLVWLGAPPGAEESVLQGIEDVLGGGVPIVGGSTADNTVEGHWKQITRDGVTSDAIVVSALFPSGRVGSAFHSGYVPSGRGGRITRVAGRTIVEIDGRPAAEVYDEWLGGALADTLASGGNILGRTTLHPLGRRVGEAGGAPYYRLAHPDAVTAERGLSVFADVAEGDELVLMSGTAEGLLTRAGTVALEVLGGLGLGPDEATGALVVFCAGCMLTVRERMDAVVDSLRGALGTTPFLGVFTFGEQGCFAGGENRHGNLMISVTTFVGG